MDDDVIGWLLGGFIGVMMLGLLALFGWLIVDSVQEYRSFDARAACQTHRMEPMRRSMSTHVVCLPINTRQDTTTVNVNAKTQ